MDCTAPCRMRLAAWRALTLSLVALLAGGAASDAASAVAVCQKTNPHGKSIFKLRDACLTDKGETEVPIGTRTQVFHTFTDSQQAITDVDIAIPVDGVNTSFSFDTTGAHADAVITFTAGCHIKDETGAGWIDIDLVVDGEPVAPTDLPRNGFCFVPGVNDEIEHTNSYTVAVNDLGPGTHSVQALASNVSVTPSAFIGDVSLVVTVHEH